MLDAPRARPRREGGPIERVAVPLQQRRDVGEVPKPHAEAMMVPGVQAEMEQLVLRREREHGLAGDPNRYGSIPEGARLDREGARRHLEGPVHLDAERAVAPKRREVMPAHALLRHGRTIGGSVA